MYKITVIFLFLISFISCKPGTSETQDLLIHDKTEWTYALYMAADNNLERFALKNIKEIKENLGTQKINFIVLLDRTSGYDKTEGNWTDTKILELHADTELNSDEYKLPDLVQLSKKLFIQNNLFTFNFICSLINKH